MIRNIAFGQFLAHASARPVYWLLELLIAAANDLKPGHITFHDTGVGVEEIVSSHAWLPGYSGGDHNYMCASKGLTDLFHTCLIKDSEISVSVCVGIET
jgi:hypothetical protein